MKASPLPQPITMILAALLAVLLTCFLAAPPALAATSTTTAATNYYSHDGVLVTWSDDSLSDLTVRPTTATGTSSSSPEAAYVGKEIAEAWQATRSPLPHTTRTTSLYAMVADTNGCSFSPDSWGRADFLSTCNEHDICYSSTSTVSRLTCDTLFRDRLRQVCIAAYGPTGFHSSACRGVAIIYYGAVRVAGEPFYLGQGDPS